MQNMRQNLTPFITSQGKTKRLKQHQKCGLSLTMVMPSFISFGIMCLCLLTEWEEKHPLGTIVERTFSSYTETILLNISSVKKNIILMKLVDFTVRIQQRMGTEKCNLLSNDVFIPLFCSTFKTNFNFKFLLTSY